jgi:hypothetical protein
MGDDDRRDVMSADLNRPGRSEDFKAVYHGLIVAVLAPAFAYNSWRLATREPDEPKGHLAVNVALLGAVLAVEIFGNLPRHVVASRDG